MSDTNSTSDQSEPEEIDEFDDVIEQLHTLEKSYHESITRLKWIQDHMVSTVLIDGMDLDTILDELHAESLQEIEQTGQSSFGSKLIKKLNQNNVSS